MGFTADIHRTYNRALLGADFTDYLPDVSKTGQTISSTMTMNADRAGDYYQVQLHYAMPANETQGSSFSSVNVDIIDVGYYGISFVELPDVDFAQLYFPDTWNPQRFVAGKTVFQYVTPLAGLHRIEFKLDDLVLSRGARFWISLYLPFKPDDTPVDATAVAFFAVKLSLVDSKIIPGHWLPPTPGVVGLDVAAQTSSPRVPNKSRE